MTRTSLVKVCLGFHSQKKEKRRTEHNIQKVNEQKLQGDNIAKRCLMREDPSDFCENNHMALQVIH